MNFETPSKNNTQLSNREMEVLRLLMKGLANRQIAAKLRICEKAVEKHLTNIYKKAGISSRAEAILWGMEKGRDFPT
jgi:DNA-binding NarL/FixJ family response regulator